MRAQARLEGDPASDRRFNRPDVLNVRVGIPPVWCAFLFDVAR
jgi:hypothetical protein